MIAAIALLLVLTVAAAEPTGVLTMSCEGTLARSKPSAGNTYPDYAQPEPVSMNVLLNFATQKVEIAGFSSVAPINIIFSTETSVSFGTYDGKGNAAGGFIAVINRVTGEMEANDTVIDTHGLHSTTHYSLKCKPTQRMF
jgi:hypothetical protein